MSKIYEALLRAELERTAVTGSPANGAAVAVQDLLVPPHESEYSNDPLDIEPVQVDSKPPVQIPEVVAQTLQTEYILEKPWTPILSALPALEERGPGVEQFRSLRSHVSEFREQKPLKTLLVSSGLPGEGKSFVTLNLALSFSRHKGNRVLLIDGDMRRSSLHKVLGAPREPGLAEYLSGEAELLDVMQRPRPSAGVAFPPGLAALTFIGGGRDADKAGDLAANSRFSELVQAVSPSFDWIIVDSSPVNLVSDAISLAHACDGVLLVCREGVTRFKTAQQAQAQFKSANVLGFVLNAVHKLPKGDYYGSYDSYKAEA
ncbi:MAG: CpsD/CapB family tyrosine-protein kinase [Janthinobacterium lividum]